MNKIMNNQLLPAKSGSTQNLKIHGYEITEKIGSLSFYGSDKTGIQKLMQENELLAEPLSREANITAAQVIWAVRNEMARTVEDVLARRIRVLFTDARLAILLAPKVADIMMKELNHNEIWKENQVKTFTQLAKGYLPTL
jgi:glycerol-3-phosphate dehydrogenase